MDAALDAGAYDASLRADVSALFTACLHLAKEEEEYDAETDATVRRFRRDPEWRDALTIIRRLLKKHHNHEDLPMRRCLAKWRVLRDKLLPMISRFHGERCVGEGRGRARVFTCPPPRA